MPIELELRRGWWHGYGMFLGVVGVLAALAVIPFLGVAASGNVGGGLVAAVIAGGLAAATLPAASAAWHLGHAHPKVRVEDDVLIIDHPGFFRRPVRLDRNRVHSVYVGELGSTRSRPKFEGTRGERFRAWNQWVNAESGRADVPIRPLYAPDLSGLFQGESRNLLIVLVPALTLEPFARRGLGLLSLAMGRAGGHSGPTSATVARGIFGRISDEAQARIVLSSWLSTTAPPADVWEWLRPPPNRWLDL